MFLLLVLLELLQFFLDLVLWSSQPEFQVLLAQYYPYILAMGLPALVHLYHLPQYLATLVEPQSHLCRSQLLRVMSVELLVRLYHLLQLRATQAELRVQQ